MKTEIGTLRARSFTGDDGSLFIALDVISHKEVAFLSDDMTLYLSMDPAFSAEERDLLVKALNTGCREVMCVISPKHPAYEIAKDCYPLKQRIN